MKKKIKTLSEKPVTSNGISFFFISHIYKLVNKRKQKEAFLLFSRNL